MAKSRKGNTEADDRFKVRMLLGEFSKQIGDGEPAPTPQGLFIELMNGDSLASESKTRIERIIQLFRGLKEYQALISISVREKAVSAITEAYMHTLLDMSAQLNRLLSQYAVIPQIQPLWPEPHHYFLPADAFSPPTDSMKRIEAKQAEVGAVLTIVQLAQRNKLQDVKECLCGMYFLAGRIDQNYCSVKCRVKAHQSSDEFKEERRRADRARYRMHRDGKVKEGTGRKHGTQKTR